VPAGISPYAKGRICLSSLRSSDMALDGRPPRPERFRRAVGSKGTHQPVQNGSVKWAPPPPHPFPRLSLFKLLCCALLQFHFRRNWALVVWVRPTPEMAATLRVAHGIFLSSWITPPPFPAGHSFPACVIVLHLPPLAPPPGGRTTQTTGVSTIRRT